VQQRVEAGGLGLVAERALFERRRDPQPVVAAGDDEHPHAGLDERCDQRCALAETVEIQIEQHEVGLGLQQGGQQRVGLARRDQDRVDTGAGEGGVQRLGEEQVVLDDRDARHLSWPAAGRRAAPPAAARS
jgi:hypothetical protein